MRALILLACLLAPSAAIVCYRCGGGGDNYCNDPPNLSHLVAKPCEADEVCAKIIYDYYVRRTCAPRNICSSGFPGSWKYCETCEVDMCNRAPSVSKDLAWVISFGVVLYTLLII